MVKKRQNLVNVVCERPPSKVKQRLHHHKIFAVLLQQHKSQCIFHYDVDGKILWKLACQNSLGSKVGVLKALVVKNSVLHDFGFGKVSPAKQL